MLSTIQAQKIHFSSVSNGIILSNQCSERCWKHPRCGDLINHNKPRSHEQNSIFRGRATSVSCIVRENEAKPRLSPFMRQTGDDVVKKQNHPVFDCQSYELIKSGQEGWIYLVSAKGTTRYKIGRTKNLPQRQSELQRQSPFPLEVIDSFWSVDTLFDEKYLHEQYEAARVFGEWFDKELAGANALYVPRPFNEFWVIKSLAYICSAVFKEKGDFRNSSSAFDYEDIRQSLRNIIYSIQSFADYEFFHRFVAEFIPKYFSTRTPSSEKLAGLLDGVATTRVQNHTFRF